MGRIVVLASLALVVGYGCSRPPRAEQPRPGGAGTTVEAIDTRPSPQPVAAPAPQVVVVLPDPGPPLPPEVAGSDEHPVRILFEEGKSQVPEIAYPLLDAVAERLRLRRGEVLRLIGHSDSLERPGGAIELSHQRIDAIRRYLEERGVDANRFIVDARGDFQPLGDNETPEGRAMNRRVDFMFEQGMMPP